MFADPRLQPARAPRHHDGPKVTIKSSAYVELFGGVVQSATANAVLDCVIEGCSRRPRSTDLHPLSCGSTRNARPTPISTGKDLYRTNTRPPNWPSAAPCGRAEHRGAHRQPAQDQARHVRSAVTPPQRGSGAPGHCRALLRTRRGKAGRFKSPPPPRRRTGGSCCSAASDTVRPRRRRFRLARRPLGFLTVASVLFIGAVMAVLAWADRATALAGADRTSQVLALAFERHVGLHPG